MEAWQSGWMHQSWKLARMKVLREFESHRFRQYLYRKPSKFNVLMGFLSPRFSLVPAMVPTYSSNPSLVRGGFLAYLLVLVRSFYCDTAGLLTPPQNLWRAAAPVLWPQASLDAGMTLPSLIRRPNWNCLKVWVFILAEYLVLLLSELCNYSNKIIGGYPLSIPKEQNPTHLVPPPFLVRWNLSQLRTWMRSNDCDFLWKKGYYLTGFPVLLVSLAIEISPHHHFYVEIRVHF